MWSLTSCWRVCRRVVGVIPWRRRVTFVVHLCGCRGQHCHRGGHPVYTALCVCNGLPHSIWLMYLGNPRQHSILPSITNQPTTIHPSRILPACCSSSKQWWWCLLLISWFLTQNPWLVTQLLAPTTFSPHGNYYKKYMHTHANERYSSITMWRNASYLKFLFILNRVLSLSSLLGSKT